MADDNTLTGSNQPDTTTPDQPPEAAESQEQQVSAEAERSESEKSEETPAKAEGSDEGKQEKKSKLPQWVQDLRRDKRNLNRRLARANQEIGRLTAEAPPAEDDVAGTIRRASRESALESQFDGVRSEMEELQVRWRQAWDEVSAEAAARIPDFAQVVGNLHAPITETMAEEIMETDIPAEVAYYLCKNIAEARRIAEMSPRDVAREIGRLESRLSPPKVKTISSAPKPLQTVTAKAGHITGKSPNQLASDMGEYAKYWEQREGLAKR